MLYIVIYLYTQIKQVMELQEKIAVEYFLQASHLEQEYAIIMSCYIRKGFKINFRWIWIETTKDLIVFHQN